MSLLQKIEILLLLPLLCISQDSFFCDDFSNGGSNWNSQSGSIQFNTQSSVNICNAKCMKIGTDSTVYSDSIPVSNKKSIYMKYDLDLCEYSTNDWDYFYIRVKIDGASWSSPIKTYSNGGCDMTNQQANFPSVADGAATIQVQFQSDSFPSTNAYLDDLCIYGTPIIAPTTKQPTTAIPTSAIPTAIPTTNNPTTSMPTTSIPTTSIPTTSQPTTSKPTTFQPTTSKPTTIQPTTAAPTTDMPATDIPTTSISTTIQPTTRNPASDSTTTKEQTKSLVTTPNPTYKPSVQPTAGGEGAVDNSKLSTTLVSDDSNDALNESSMDGMIYLIIGILASFCTLLLLFILCKYYLSKRKNNEYTKKEQQYKSDIQLSSASNLETNVNNSQMIRIQSVSMSPRIGENGENINHIAQNNNDFGANLTNLVGVNNLLMDDVINDVQTPKTAGNDSLFNEDDDSNENIVVTPNGDDLDGIDDVPTEEGTDSNNVPTEEGTDSNNDDDLDIDDIELVKDGTTPHGNINKHEFIIHDDKETPS